ncbi:MAG: hypothetical protein KGI29_03815 [Pseudomonadota bacterium]|nr:hypothetical protein [Pseudomonadota bacterium]MDE3038315.1 hypothetical protein [Pseudomonadota bacterium]
MWKFCCNYYKGNKFVALLLCILLVGVIVAAYWSKEEILPTFFVSLVSLMVVYGSSQDSKNKLRLEIFEKRYAIYEELIKFCSHTLQHGAIIKRRYPQMNWKLFDGLTNIPSEADTKKILRRIMPEMKTLELTAHEILK